MQESDALEDQNVNFRSEIQRLEAEKRRLMDVLAMHSPTCLKTGEFDPVLPSLLLSTTFTNFLTPVSTFSPPNSKNI